MPPLVQIMACCLFGAKPLSESIQTFPFKKMHLQMSSAKYRPFCLGLNVLSAYPMPNLAANLSVLVFFFISTQNISFNKIHLKVSFTKSCPFCPELNVLKKYMEIASKKSGLPWIWAKFVIMMPWCPVEQDYMDVKPKNQIYVQVNRFT